jgi:hypothetical protein
MEETWQQRVENIHVSTIYCSLLFTALIFQQNCFLADILNEKQKGTVPSFPSPTSLFILFLPYVCNVELFLNFFRWVHECGAIKTLYSAARWFKS